MSSPVTAAEKDPPYKIAVAGLGTVGCGVVEILQKHEGLLARRTDRPIEIVAVSARSKGKDRGVDLSAYKWMDDPQALTADPDIDCVVELIGGSEGVAYDLVKAALNAGKDVVTANKALLAHHGDELARLAEDKGGALAYEAAVAGGIPIIKTLREGFAANRISGLHGILNGTCNYILTEMRESGRSFDAVLKDAQDLGYAEADPTFDIDGIDAAHKLAILTALAFGVRIDFERVRVSGIRHVSDVDIAFAEEFGYRIKLLGVARQLEDGTLLQSVEPCLVPRHSAVGAIDGAFNAVFTEGDFVGPGAMVGLGAGRGPTASAVVADLVDLCMGQKRPVFSVPAKNLTPADYADSAAVSGHFYLRLSVLDKPGVIADVSAILRDCRISIEALMQRGRDPGQQVPVVMITHDARQADLARACEQMAALSTVLEPPRLFRIEKIASL